MKLKPSDIHFSQDSISNTFGKKTQHRNTYIGETLDELINGTITVFSIPTISVFKHEGKWFTSDNRRLWVFRKTEELGILSLIPVLKTFDFDAAKFTTNNGGLNVRVRRNDPGGQTWLLLEGDRSRNKYQNYTHTLTQINTEKPRKSYSRTSTNFNHPYFEELKSRTDHDYERECDSYFSSNYSESSKENRPFSGLVNYSKKPPRQSYTGSPNNSRHTSLEKLTSRPDHEYKRENDSYGSPIYSKSSQENCHNTGVENNIEKPRISYSRSSINFNHLSFEELNSRTDNGYKREYDPYGSSRYSRSPKENRPHCDLISYSEKPRQSYSGSPTYSSHTSFEKLKSRTDHDYKREYDSHGSSSYSESSKENRPHSGLVNYSEKPRQSYSGSPTYSSHNSLEKLSSRPDCGYKSEYDSDGSSNCSKSSKESCPYSGLVNYYEEPRQSYSRTSTNFNLLSFEELEWRSSYGYEREYSRHKDRCTRTKLDLIDGVIAVGALAYLFMKLL